MRRLVWFGCFAYFMVGLATVVFGALMPELLREYGRSYSGGGQLVFGQFAGFFLGVLLAPLSSMRIGEQWTIRLGMLSLVMAHAFLFSQPGWMVVLALAVLNGFGFGMTQTAIGTFILERAGHAGAVMMSRLEVAFGLGALFMPLAAGFLIAQHQWNGAFGIVMLLAALNFVLWIRKLPSHSSEPMEETRHHPQNHHDTSKVKHAKPFSKLVIFIVFVFLYVGIETSAINFMPSIFVQHLKQGTSEATVSVTVFWMAMVIGRVFTGYAAEKISYFRFLFISASGAILFLVGMTVVKGAALSFALVFMLGLCLSGIFAIWIVFANRLFPGNTKQITSILIASGGVGGAILPLLVGWSLDQYQATSTIWLISAFALMLPVCLLLIRRFYSREISSQH